MEIEIQEGEEVILPFKYVLQDGKPFISEKIIAIVKRDEGF
jgi:ribosome biogenesis SPOUT family RNA methylase Rps3